MPDRGLVDTPITPIYDRQEPSSWRPEGLDVSIKELEADLARLEERADALKAELATVEAEANRLRQFLDKIREFPDLVDRYGFAASSSGDIERNNPGADALAEACRGKSIPDAAVAILALFGRPLSEQQIVDALKKGGVTLVSDRPILNIRFALLKKKKEGEAVNVERDIWTVGELKPAMPVNSGAVQGRNRTDHAEKSRKGLLAARERGVKNGRRSTLTPEVREKAIRLIEEGLTGRQIASQLGVSQATFSKWRNNGWLGEELR